MMNILTLVLLVLCILLLIYIYFMRKQLKHLLLVLKSVKNGSSQKAFAKNNGLTSEIAYEVNDILKVYQTEISSLKKVEQANKEILTSLSHDVRTPLTSLLGYLDALKDGIVEGTEKEEYIKVSRKKAYDLKGLVDTLFDWFKIDSNEMKLSRKNVDINEITREILIDWLPVFEQNSIIPESHISDEEYIVMLDSSSYKRIISNIIQNAVDHSFCTALSITSKKTNNSVSIIIKDNGKGIPSNKLPHIFDRLYKCDSARTRRSSGLGLCISKELTEMHRGTIEAKSILGEYTSFIITLPL